MKILWLCNIPITEIALKLEISGATSGGWITGMLNTIKSNKRYNLTVCFPVNGINELQNGSCDNLGYYLFPATNPTHYNTANEKYFKQIINQTKPDIVHIFGTEFSHSLAMTKAFDCPNRTVVNLQGISHTIASHYSAGLPEKVQRSFTLRDILRQSSLLQEKKAFAKRAQFEKETMLRTNNFIGRTTWDKACSTLVNPNAKYHFCNETLRNEFYCPDLQWQVDKCMRFSIFMSQSSIPLKGLHFLIEAMPKILEKFPQAHLYAAGNDPRGGKTFKSKLKVSSYGKYIGKLIKKLHLQNAISFTGVLSAEEMRERFLKSHVFVSPSTIENESNSLSEAKILGVPSVASYVGGVTDRIDHGVDGFHYQHDAPYMLAYYIREIFSDDKLAFRLSENAKKNAAIVNDPATNSARIIEIYETIANGS